jgi:ATP-dependent RNA helicase HelY
VDTRRAELIAHYTFPLDAFQLHALDALDDGKSVVVAAPTGSGKTVVAEYAVDLMLSRGQRAFYTAPVKALSNQKYHDLVDRLGPQNVGLLTGDNVINGEAPVVVMTTEVLRNMIYARSAALGDLGAVVLDEVHFLQDTYRGPVWEEVIIHLDPHVRLVCLSATVSNAAELAEWIGTVRGPTECVMEERRPVRLDNLYFVGDRTHEQLHLLPVLVNGRPNHDAARIDDEALRPGRGARNRRGSHARRKLYTPSRLDVVDVLEQRGMLPAIYFIFSRNQCDEAARASLAAGLRLTTGTERERIREIADDRLGGIEPADLAVLGYGQFLAQLEAGVAAHHAGMVPPFKEVVELCFAEGLVKVVFATETLAVGINMPAKTVVIDKLTKFTGDHHAFLSPGEYTQLTGRAGRRGLDDLGHAMVLWSPFVPFEQVATLAASRSFHLNSAFRPTYNMAANLVRSYTSEQAHHLLNLSFAQFQADRDLVKLETRLQRRQLHLGDLMEAARSPYGDIDEYRAMLAGTSKAPSTGGSSRDGAISLALMKLRPGDVIYAQKGRYHGPVAVLTTAQRKDGFRVTGLTTGSVRVHLTAGDFDRPPGLLGTITLPDDFAPNRTAYQRQVASRLVAAQLTPHAGRRGPRADPDTAVEHAVLADPDIAARLKAAAQAERLTREIEDLRTRMGARNQTISRDFDRVLDVLKRYGYVHGWRLTERGEVLARTFHECDLLVVEALHRGLLDDLEPSALAGLVSVFVYEHRTPDAPPAPWFPSAAVRRKWEAILDLSDDLCALEDSVGLTVHRAPDPTFIAIAFAWAAGEGFAEVVEAEQLTGGDFVRTTKQLIDLLRQLALVAPNRATRRAAGDAADRLFRGVVAASSSIEAEVDETVETLTVETLPDETRPDEP